MPDSNQEPMNFATLEHSRLVLSFTVPYKLYFVKSTSVYSTGQMSVLLPLLSNSQRPNVLLTSRYSPFHVILHTNRPYPAQPGNLLGFEPTFSLSYSVILPSSLNIVPILSYRTYSRLPVSVSATVLSTRNFSSRLKKKIKFLTSSTNPFRFILEPVSLNSIYHLSLKHLSLRSIIFLLFLSCYSYKHYYF